MFIDELWHHGDGHGGGSGGQNVLDLGILKFSHRNSDKWGPHVIKELLAKKNLWTYSKVLSKGRRQMHSYQRKHWTKSKLHYWQELDNLSLHMCRSWWMLHLLKNAASSPMQNSNQPPNILSASLTFCIYSNFLFFFHQQHYFHVNRWPNHLMKRQNQVSDLESNNVLSVDLTDVMFGQQTVASSRAILDQWGDFTGLVDKAHVAWAVFVHGDGALKWPGETHTDAINALMHRRKALVKTSCKYRHVH